MPKRFAAAAFAVLICATFPGPILAQRAPCQDRNEIVQMHADRYGEVPVARAGMPNGCVLEFLAAPDGSWSQLLWCPHFKDGWSCLNASGDGWTATPSPRIRVKPERGS